MGKIFLASGEVLANLTNMFWNDTFDALFERCAGAYKAGNFNWKKDYSTEDLEFLGSIGYKKREFFDFVEDFIGAEFVRNVAPGELIRVKDGVLAIPPGQNVVADLHEG